MDYSHNIAYNKQQYSINEVYNTKEGMKDTEIDIIIDRTEMETAKITNTN